MIETVAPSASGQTRSRSTPLTSPITASLASREPMSAASPATVVPAGTDRSEPSGNVIVMSAMRASVRDRPGPPTNGWGPLSAGSGRLATEHVGRRAGRRGVVELGVLPQRHVPLLAVSVAVPVGRDTDRLRHPLARL